MMTTLTTIIDLLPMALGLGEGSESTSPMAISVVGGLTFALVLSLFFVPYVYLIAKQRNIFGALMNFLGRKKAALSGKI
jgi:HAE1 family hydrophobic/amphiphilic exporter-1